MAKGGNLSPMEAERRRQRTKELKKVKDQRQQQKMERLRTMDPRRIEQRIVELETKKEQLGRLLAAEDRILDSLRNDLVQLRRLRGEDTTLASPKEYTQDSKEQDEESSELGPRSVFYDPEWNPLGRAPEGFANVTIDSITTPHDYPADPEAAKIPLPEGPPPKFYKPLDAIQTSYQNDAQVPVRSVKTFVPNAVKRKLDQV